ncbi:hypothetical protein FOPE_10926 [Fonsecaea pedrosoi]|nr:hypothetical protein FOPE_10926 [Fonsecaea pedrosoi]
MLHITSFCNSLFLNSTQSLIFHRYLLALPVMKSEKPSWKPAEAIKGISIPRASLDNNSLEILRYWHDHEVALGDDMTHRKG